MSVLHPSSIRSFLIFRPRHHVFPNVSFSKHKTALLPNDGVLPTTGKFTEYFEENFMSNDVALPSSAYKSVSFLYQFWVLTSCLSFLSSSSLPRRSFYRCSHLLFSSAAPPQSYILSTFNMQPSSFLSQAIGHTSGQHGEVPPSPLVVDPRLEH
jgi:hypothetical protein